MRVEIGELHKDSYGRIIKDVNAFVKKFKEPDYKKSATYEELLLKKNITLYKKKDKLLESLRKLAINTFSIDIDKVKDKKKVFETLKHNLNVLRNIVHKLKDINYFLEEIFLSDLGIIKRDLKIFDSKNPEKLLEKAKFSLGKGYIDKLEHTTYNLIEKIIIFDKNLLKQYKAKEEKVIKEKEKGVRGFKSIIETQSDLLHHLEAKLPPKSKASIRLLQKKIYSEWISRVFSLIAAIKAEHKKELNIIRNFKKNSKAFKIINKKIHSIQKEKTELLKIKQKRLINSARLTKENNELRILLQDFSAARNL